MHILTHHIESVNNDIGSLEVYALLNLHFGHTKSACLGLSK